MRVGIIWKNEYPWDVRIEKIALALKNSGNDVLIMCANKEGRSRVERIHGIEIQRLPFSRLKFLNSIISSPFYLNPFWFYMAYKATKQKKIDLIIIRDLPLITIGILIKALLKPSLVLDMAEDYPAMYMGMFKKGGLSSIKTLLLKNPFLMRYVERLATKRVDHVFVVVEESKLRLLESGVRPDKIDIVSNTPNLSSFSGVEPRPKRDLREIRMVYCGFVQRSRGLDTAIEALPAITNAGTMATLMVIGTGYYLDTLKDKVRENSLQDSVDFKGWIDNKKIFEYIESCDVGIIPHIKDSHTDTTIPNKLFDFMACGKPVIVSNTNPMKRIVEEEKCGVVFESGNRTSFIDAFSRLISDVATFNEMGRNGREAVMKRYNWAMDSRTINRALGRLIG